MASLSFEAGEDVVHPRRHLRGLGVHALVAALRHCWNVGDLTVVGPDGEAHRIQGAQGGADVRFDIHDPRTVRRVLSAGDVGFADSYIAGEWDSPDLARLLTAMSANFDRLAQLIDGAPWLRALNAVAHALNRNSRRGSRRNICAHYDLGDDFYRLWLDGGMNYSSALFADGRRDLVAGQRAKHAALAQAMDLQRGQSLLEIGCGWGDFARFAATEYDAKVTAVTVSIAQRDHAARMIQAQGLSERVDVRLCDYRDLDGRYDRVGSIEMLEAVGEAYWPIFFRKLDSLLAHAGRAALQVITIREDLFDGYRRRPDFIQLNVFPGGMLPSERRLQQETDQAGFSWTGVRRFGHDYADTLAEWARRYVDRSADVRAQGFDTRFDRLWRYYLAYCEAGFRTGRTDVVQLGLMKA